MDPVSAALNIVKSICDKASQAKTNREDCLQLATLAQRTFDVLQQVEGRVERDSAISISLEVLNDALEQSNAAVKECCEVSVFIGLFQASRFNEQLKQAASSLAYALDQIPLATVGITSDIYDCVFSLKEELNRARFQQTAQDATRTRRLKEEMEILYKDSRRSGEELKGMIKTMIDENSLTAEQQQQDLDVLKTYLIQANKNKERQEAYEIEQVIAAMESSKEEMAKTSITSTLDQIEAVIKCPINKEPMKDPVLLKDSYMTYDRSSITEWIRLCNRRDPMTNSEIVSGELLPNLAIKSIAEVFIGTEVEIKQTQPVASDIQQRLIPGLYEGYGSYESDMASDLQFTALVLEPDGNIVGCTLARYSSEQPFERFIFRGKWQADSPEMQWKDEYYINTCTVVINPDSPCAKFSLKGTSTPHAKSLHPNTIQYKTFHFDYPQMTLAPLLYHRVPLPGLLEMEGVLQSKGKEFKQKLVVSVHEDSSFNGWLRVVDLPSNDVSFGRISAGNMQNLDEMNFSVQFTNSIGESKQADGLLGTLKFTGSLTQRGGVTSLQTNEVEGFARYSATSSASSSSSISLAKLSEFTFNTVRQTSREIPERLRCLIKLLRPPSEPERDFKSGTFKIWTADEVEIDGVTQRFCMEVSRHNWMNPFDTNLVQCNWHYSHGIYPSWTVEKANGIGDYYIKTHETYWSGDREWWVPDSCYLTIEENSSFEDPKSEGYYLVVHPDKERACVWNLLYTSSGIRIHVSNVGNNSVLGQAIGCFLSAPKVQHKRGGDVVYHAVLTSDASEALKIEFDYHGVFA